MNQQLDQLRSLNKQYSELFSELEPQLEAVARKVLEARTKAYHEVMGPEHNWHGEHRYLFATDKISIYCEGGKIYAACVETGRCGNWDETNHTLEITNELLTDEGIQKDAEEFKAELVAEKAKQEQEKVAAKQRRTEALKKELSELEGGAK